MKVHETYNKTVRKWELASCKVPVTHFRTTRCSAPRHYEHRRRSIPASLSQSIRHTHNATRMSRLHSRHCEHSAAISSHRHCEHSAAISSHHHCERSAAISSHRHCECSAAISFPVIPALAVPCYSQKPESSSATLFSFLKVHTAAVTVLVVPPKVLVVPPKVLVVPPKVLAAPLKVLTAPLKVLAASLEVLAAAPKAPKAAKTALFIPHSVFSVFSVVEKRKTGTGTSDEGDVPVSRFPYGGKQNINPGGACV